MVVIKKTSKSLSKLVIILQARMSSKRLPGKSLKLINNIPLVILCAKRLKNKGHKLIVATSKEKSDDNLVKILKKNKINFFRGSKENVFSRFLNISKKFKPEDLIVRATADNILPDGNLVKLLNNEIKRRKLNYLSINKKIHLLPKGFSLEIFKVKELLRINKSKLSKKHLEHVTLKMRENKKYLKNIVIKKLLQKNDLSKYRMTIDTKKDYLYMKKFFQNIKGLLTYSSFEIIKYLRTTKILNK